MSAIIRCAMSEARERSLLIKFVEDLVEVYVHPSFDYSKFKGDIRRTIILPEKQHFSEDRVHYAFAPPVDHVFDNFLLDFLYTPKMWTQFISGIGDMEDFTSRVCYLLYCIWCCRVMDESRFELIMHTFLLHTVSFFTQSG